MASFVTAVTDFMRGNFCAALDVLGDAVTLGSKISVGPVGAVNIANGLGSLVCDRPPDNLQPPEPDFTGGQCPGALYRVDYEFKNGSGPWTPAMFVQAGPLRLSRALDPTDSSAGCLDGETFTRFTMIGFNGERRNLASGCAAQVRNISVSSFEGSPNNCGDPSPVYPEPGDTYNVGGDVTYNIDESTEVTVPITAVYAPIFVDLDGSLKIPVTIDVGGVNFKGELEVAPKFELNIRPTQIVAGPGRPDDDDPSGGQPQVPVPEDGEDNDVIVGVLVFSTLVGDTNNATGFPSVGGPTFLVPRICSVQFAIKTGNSIGWTSDIDVKNLECYVPCPAPQGAIAVRVTPGPGVTRTFTAVRGKPLTSF